ncbi:hypothetical protein [Nonomuraea sp. B1E8]|uniref:hypothetical protein n=1 Tax=unclassified Nonomuraea TaxID=2593643 RepID=UPI00325E0C8A
MGSRIMRAGLAAMYVIGVAFAGAGPKSLLRLQPAAQPSRHRVSRTRPTVLIGDDRLTTRVVGLLRGGEPTTPEPLATSGRTAHLHREVPTAVFVIVQVHAAPAELLAGGRIDASAPLVHQDAILMMSHCPALS